MRCIPLLSAVLLIACQSTCPDPVGVDMHHCPIGKKPYIVSRITPESWIGAPERMALFSSRNEDDVLLEGDAEAFGHAEPGDRVCVKHGDIPEEGALTDFKVSDVEGVPESDIVCTIEASLDILEWMGWVSGANDPVGVGIGAENVGDEETVSPGITVYYYRTWWLIESTVEVLRDPPILATDDSPPYEEFPINTYEYRLPVPETLADIIFCRNDICSDDELYIDYWISPDFGWSTVPDPNDCRLEP